MGALHCPTCQAEWPAGAKVPQARGLGQHPGEREEIPEEEEEDVQGAERGRATRRAGAGQEEEEGEGDERTEEKGSLDENGG